MHIHPLGTYSLQEVQFQEDGRSVLVTGWEEGELWAWDTDLQELLARANRSGWRYRQTRTDSGSQAWAVIDDRLLTTLELALHEDPPTVRARALGTTNTRICPDDLSPVPVVPFPSSDSPWAPTELCESAAR